MRWRVVVVAASVAIAAYGVAGTDHEPAQHATWPCRSTEHPTLPRLVPAALEANADMPRFTDVRTPSRAQLAGLYPEHGGPHLDSTVCLVNRGGHDQLMVVTEHVQARYYGPPPVDAKSEWSCVEFVDAGSHDRHATRCF